MNRILSFLILLSAVAINSWGHEKEITTLDGSKGKLYTVIQRPDTTPGTPVSLVIMCHGFGGDCDYNLYDAAADDLLNNGIAVLRFDFNGHGRSEGQFKDMTVSNEIQDLESVISWAMRQPWVKDISLVGHSQGGVVVSMTAGELGDGTIRNLVLLAPAAVLRDDALRGNTMGAIYDPWNLSGDYVQLPFGDVKLGRKFIEEAVKLPIYETALRYNGPVLIVHGTHDRVVPYTYGERYHQGYANSSMRLIPGDDHVFSTTTTQTAREVASWLTKKLK